MTLGYPTAYIGTPRAKFVDSKKRKIIRKIIFFDFSAVTKLNRNNYIFYNVCALLFFLRFGVFFTYPLVIKIQHCPLYADLG